MNIVGKRNPFKDDWRRARVQILEHIRQSETWDDIMNGIDTLFYIKRKAKPLIDEHEMVEAKEIEASEKT